MTWLSSARTEVFMMWFLYIISGLVRLLETDMWEIFHQGWARRVPGKTVTGIYVENVPSWIRQWRNARIIKCAFDNSFVETMWQDSTSILLNRPIFHFQKLTVWENYSATSYIVCSLSDHVILAEKKLDSNSQSNSIRLLGGRTGLT